MTYEFYMEDGTWTWYNLTEDFGVYGYDTEEEARAAAEVYENTGKW